MVTSAEEQPWWRRQPATLRLPPHETGGIATLICDGAADYRGTYYDDAWTRENKFDPNPYTEVIDRFLAGGEWTEPEGGI